VWPCRTNERGRLTKSVLQWTNQEEREEGHLHISGGR